jgi:hypothetical protein
MQKKLMTPAVVVALMVSVSACSHPPNLPVTMPDAVRLDFAIDPVSNNVAAGPLTRGHTFGQAFIAGHNGLTKIEVLVATYTASLPSGYLILHLSGYPDQQNDIASATIPAKTITDNSYVALQFSPIRNSAGKSYYFYLEARDIPSKYALTVWHSTTDVYPQGRFYIDRRPQDQDIYFRVFYQTSDPSSLENSIVVSKEDGLLYLIQRGERRWIRDPQWLAHHGYASQSPVWLSVSQLRQIPVGPSIGYFPVHRQIRIGAYTGILFLFFFLVIYRKEHVQKMQRASTVLLQRWSLDPRALLFAGFVLLMWFRAPSLLIHPRFWAEEGSTWFQYASAHSLIQDLFYIYPPSGYLNLMANIGGILSSRTARFLKIEYAPLATTIAAFVIQILAIAIILYGKSRLFRSRWRAVCACLIVLFAPTSVSEVWLNTINSMSYLGLITLLLLFENLSAWPSWIRWGVRGLLVLCGLSAAYSIALLPLFLLSFFRYRERERKVQCFILGGCLVVQIGCLIFSKLAGGGLPYRGTGLTADLSSVNVLFWHMAVPALGQNVAHALFGTLGLTGAWMAAFFFAHVWDPTIRLAGLLSFIIIVGVFWLLLRHRDENKLFLGASFLIFAVLTCVGSLYSVPTGRYAFLPGLVFLFLLASNIESGARRVRSLICMLVLSFALVNGMVSYRIRPDPNAPIWSSEVAKWRTDHTYKPRIWPPWWSLPINLNPK